MERVVGMGQLIGQDGRNLVEGRIAKLERENAALRKIASDYEDEIRGIQADLTALAPHIAVAMQLGEAATTALALGQAAVVPLALDHSFSAESDLWTATVVGIRLDQPKVVQS